MITYAFSAGEPTMRSRRAVSNRCDLRRRMRNAVSGRSAVSVQGQSALQALDAAARTPPTAGSCTARRKPLQLVFLQPLDYWHKPPEMPNEYWTSAFRRSGDSRSERGESARRAAAALRVHRRVAATNFATGGSLKAIRRRCSTDCTTPRAIKTPYELECMRGRRRAAAQWTPCRRGRIPRRGFGIRNPSCVSARDADTPKRAAVPEHRRAESQRRGAALSASGATRARRRRPAFVPDRRRRRIRRLCLRHHAHVFPR